MDDNNDAEYFLTEDDTQEPVVYAPRESNQTEDSDAQRREALMEDGDDTDGEHVRTTTEVGYASESIPIDFQSSVQVFGFLILVGLIFLIVIQTKILKELRKSKKR